MTSNGAWWTTPQRDTCLPFPEAVSAAAPAPRIFTLPVAMVFRQVIAQALTAPSGAAIGAPATRRAVALQPFPATELYDFPTRLDEVLPLLPAPLEYRLIDHDLVIRDVRGRCDRRRAARRNRQRDHNEAMKEGAMSGVRTATGGTHEPCTVMLFRTAAQDALLRRVRGEYREMPGMRLTIEQAMRLWNADRQACVAVLNSLVASQFLGVDNFGRYRKAHTG